MDARGEGADWSRLSDIGRIEGAGLDGLVIGVAGVTPAELLSQSLLSSTAGLQSILEPLFLGGGSLVSCSISYCL